jgi:8-oxo-dGTP diphosphatase
MILKADHILLGRRSEHPGKGQWATPSGYIEFDEDFLTTGVREAKEETGLEVEIVSILNVTDSFFPPKHHFLNVYLLAHVVSGQLRAGDDMESLQWFPVCGPFPDMAFPEDIDLIEYFRSHSNESGIWVEKGF